MSQQFSTISALIRKECSMFQTYFNDVFRDLQKIVPLKTGSTCKMGHSRFYNTHKSTFPYKSNGLLVETLFTQVYFLQDRYILVSTFLYKHIYTCSAKKKLFTKKTVIKYMLHLIKWHCHTMRVICWHFGTTCLNLSNAKVSELNNKYCKIIIK